MAKNKDKVLTKTYNKTIIRHGELVRILNATEIEQWHNIIAKIEQFDKTEALRKGV